MADQYGNVIPVPSFAQVDEVKPGEILKSTVGLTQVGVTLAKDQGILYAGTVLARQTSDKKYYKYNGAGSGGLEVARGVLREHTDTTGVDVLGNMVIAGILKYSVLSGIDADAIVDLAGRSDTTRDMFFF